MATFLPAFGRSLKPEDKHQRVVAHIDKLSQSKIDLCEDRLEWLEWHISFNSPSLHAPSVLVLNLCSACKSLQAEFQAFTVEEVHQEQESLESLRWLLEAVKFVRSHGWQVDPREADAASAMGVGQQRDPETEAETLQLRSAELSDASGLEPGARSALGAPDAVVLLCGSRLSVFQELVAGTVFLQGRPVLVLAEGASEEDCRDDSAKLSAGTWPVFNNQEALLRYMEHELPSMLRTRSMIFDNIYQKLERHKQVNMTWYALTRGALALVPFGVHALNTASLFDLCRQCMVDAGMRSDTEAHKAMAKGAGKTGLAEFACNSASDVYQLLVQGVILTEMVEAGSVAAAMATLDLADVFLLGTVSVVTGAVAAVTAYMSRPHLVDSIADIMAMLQFTYLVNPQMRRPRLTIPATS